MMFGWSSVATMRASRLNRSAARGVSPTAGGSTLSATRRCSSGSIASNTTSMPPRASSRSTSYSPENTRRTRSSKSSCPSGGKTTVSAWGSEARTPQLGQYRVSAASSVPHRKQRVTRSGSWLHLHTLRDGGQRVGEDRVQQDHGDSGAAQPPRDEGVGARRHGDDRRVGGAEPQVRVGNGHVVRPHGDRRARRGAEGKDRVALGVRQRDPGESRRPEQVGETAGRSRHPDQERYP